MVAVAFIMVGVAQSAERLPVEEKVAGSFPVAHPKTSEFSKNSEVFVIYCPFAYQIEPGES